MHWRSITCLWLIFWVLAKDELSPTNGRIGVGSILRKHGTLCTANMRLPGTYLAVCVNACVDQATCGNPKNNVTDTTRTANIRIIAEYLKLSREKLTLIHQCWYEIAFIFTVFQSAAVHLVFVISTQCTISAMLMPDLNHVPCLSSPMSCLCT